MDGQTGRILASIAWTIPVIWAFVIVRRHKTVFRWIVAGFALTLVLVAGVYWVLTLDTPLGLVDRQVQPFFQIAMMVIGPVIAFQLEITSRREQLLEQLLDKIEEANNMINGG